MLFKALIILTSSEMNLQELTDDIRQTDGRTDGRTNTSDLTRIYAGDIVLA